MYLYTLINMYSYINTCVYVCVYIYIYIYMRRRGAEEEPGNGAQELSTSTT